RSRQSQRGFLSPRSALVAVGLMIAVGLPAGAQAVVPETAVTAQWAFSIAAMVAFFCALTDAVLFSPFALRVRSDDESLGGRIFRLISARQETLRLALLVVGLTGTLLAVTVAVFWLDAWLRAVQLPPAAAIAIAVIVAAFVAGGLLSLLPRAIGHGLGAGFIRWAVYPLALVYLVGAPIGLLLQKAAGFLFWGVRRSKMPVLPFSPVEELEVVLAERDVDELITPDERSMIENVLKTSTVRLREILTPRPDVVAVPAGATVADALAIYREQEYSRMPVYEHDMDHITGVLFAKDMLAAVVADTLDVPVRQLQRPPYFAPETITVHDFIRDAQRRRTHLAVVVDEFGGTEGIVTLEDALEEVVGDILDEGETAAADFTQLADGVYRVRGNLSLNELSSLIGARLEDSEHETVAGFLMNHSNKLPEKGDELRWDGVRFLVEEVEGRRASAVRVILQKRRLEDMSA
ncbi:MAG: hemolysin family protein, partial [Candidatus Hydrogenedentales bacterium]